MDNDERLISACLRGAVDLIQGTTSGVSDSAMRTRMRRVADDLLIVAEDTK